MTTKAILLAGIGYGDEGKGTSTEYLCSLNNAKCVVRYNGGPQAAHNIVTNDGKHHTFSQFGSGTLLGVPTHISQHMMVDPFALAAEGRHLLELGVDKAFSMVTIDRRALLVTPYHRAANRIREAARGDGRHGSCGVGVGETMEYYLNNKGVAPVVGDILNPSILAWKLTVLRNKLVESTRGMFNYNRHTAEHAAGFDVEINALVNRYNTLMSDIALKIVTPSYAEGIFDGDGTIIFEGAQGVLLDQDYGFHPHTTWTDITFNNAERILKEYNHQGPTERVGILRSFTTRHGAGPFPTEIKDFYKEERHNGLHAWQGGFRAGPLDLVLHRYALEVLGHVDYLVMTHLDAPMACIDKMCVRYEILAEHDKLFKDPRTIRVMRPTSLEWQELLGVALNSAKPVFKPFSLQDISAELGVAIKHVSAGPRLKDKSAVI